VRVRERALYTLLSAIGPFAWPDAPTWEPAPCAAPAELEGPLGRIALTQRLAARENTVVDRVRADDTTLERIDTYDPNFPAGVLPVHVVLGTHGRTTPLPANADRMFH